MKSCVLFFFLVSLISSNTAPPPPGIKLQITENAKDVLKEVCLMFLKGLVNEEFPIDKIYLPIRSVKLTELQVDPAKVEFSFQKNIGLQIKIREMTFSLEIQREAKVPFTQINIIAGSTTLIAEVTSATLIVKMNRNPQGHLNVEIPSCIMNADTSRTTSTGFTGFVWKGLYRVLFHQFCRVLQPIINYKLKDLPMMRTVYEDRQLDLDYSLSSDIAVTSRSLDISFKGLMSVHGQAVDTGSISPGKEPVFTETNKMIYVGISEFFFNGAAMAIYKSGPFEFNVTKLEGLKSLLNPGLKALGIKPGPWTVELTEDPIIEIRQAGLSATVHFKAQHEDQQKSFLQKCEFIMDVGFRERLLIPSIRKLKCEDETGKKKDEILVGGVNFFHTFITKRLVPDIPIPLPAELSIINANTQFEEGYLVVGGGLTFNSQSSSNAGR